MCFGPGINTQQDIVNQAVVGAGGAGSAATSSLGGSGASGGAGALTPATPGLTPSGGGSGAGGAPLVRPTGATPVAGQADPNAGRTAAAQTAQDAGTSQASSGAATAATTPSSGIADVVANSTNRGSPLFGERARLAQGAALLDFEGSELPRLLYERQDTPEQQAEVDRLFNASGVSPPRFDEGGRLIGFEAEKTEGDTLPDGAGFDITKTPTIEGSADTATFRASIEEQRDTLPEGGTTAVLQGQLTAGQRNERDFLDAQLALIDDGVIRQGVEADLLTIAHEVQRRQDSINANDKPEKNQEAIDRLLGTTPFATPDEIFSLVRTSQENRAGQKVADTDSKDTKKADKQVTKDVFKGLIDLDDLDDLTLTRLGQDKGFRSKLTKKENKGKTIEFDERTRRLIFG